MLSQMIIPTLTGSDLTTLLRSWREGSGTAFASVIDQVYAELKLIAARRLKQSGGSVTLSPTEVLHEALIRIMPTPVDFKNRAHFFATISLSIRSLLVEHARARAANKRGGDHLRVAFTDLDVGEDSQAIDLLAIEQALSQLEKLDPRCGQVMHLTYFAGLSQEEISGLLNISLPTVARDLKFARGWVSKALAADNLADAAMWQRKLKPAVALADKEVFAGIALADAMLAAKQGRTAEASKGFLDAERLYRELYSETDARSWLAMLPRAEWLAGRGQRDDVALSRALANQMLAKLNTKLNPDAPVIAKLTRLQQM